MSLPKHPDALPPWSAPKPRRGAFYSAAEWDGVRHGCAQTPAVGAFRALGEAFKGWLRQTLAGYGLDEYLARDLLHEAGPDDVIAAACDNFRSALRTDLPWVTPFHGRKARTPAAAEEAYARHVAGPLEARRAFFRVASQAWIYDPHGEPQRVADLARDTPEPYTVRILCGNVLCRVHHLHFGRQWQEDIPSLGEVLDGRASVVQLLEAQRLREEAFAAGQKASSLKRRALCADAARALAPLLERRERLRVQDLNRALKEAVPGARARAASAHRARLEAPGCLWHGPSVGKARAAWGLALYLCLLAPAGAYVDESSEYRRETRARERARAACLEGIDGQS